MGLQGLKGWQWLFLIEGLPTILLGVWVRLSICSHQKCCECEVFHQQR